MHNNLIKKELRIDFVDFWTNIDKTNNYFYNLLCHYYEIIIDSENPDLIFYSCFGKEHLKYKCKRIYFTGENRRPDFMGCDFAFSFDFILRKNHYRLPLYSLYIDDEKIDKIDIVKSRDEIVKIWDQKSKFCCMVVSNPDAPERLDFYKKLSQFIEVDSGGRVLNNVGGPVKDKMDFIKDYKFVIAFENELQEGYTTEKIIEPILVDSIPIYWGNKNVDKDFNTKRFINYHDFDTEIELIERLLEINQNSNLAIDILCEPILSNERPSFDKERQEVFEIIAAVIKSDKKPKASTYVENLYLMKLFYKKIIKVIFKT